MNSERSGMDAETVMQFMKGEHLARCGNLEAAIVCFDAVLQRDRLNCGAWFNKGRCLYRLKRWPEALICFRKLANLENGVAQDLRLVADVLSELGRFKESFEIYDRALVKAGDDAVLWHSKGVAYDMAGRSKEALVCFEKAIKLDRWEANYWNSKGYTLERSGDVDGAEHAYGKALELKSNLTIAAINMSNLLGSKGKFEEALACLQKVMATGKGTADAHYNKATFLHRLGRFDEAVECCNVALDINPSHDRAKRLRAYCRAKSERGVSGLSSN